MFILQVALCSALLFVTCSTKEFKVQPNENKVILALNGTTNHANTMCYFPYVYENKLHFKCSAKNSPYSWCSTTFNYDSDQKWGYCGMKSIINDAGVVKNDKCYTFRRENNTISYGGMLVPDIKEAKKCTEECKQHENCQGITFDRVTETCFLFTDSNFLNVFRADGVDRYTRYDCLVSTIPPVTEKPTCIDTFHKRANTFTSGGKNQAGYDTAEKCQALCLTFNDKSKPTFCLGFDFNRLENDCYLLVDKVRYRIFASNEFVDRYEREACVANTTCYDKFFEKRNQHSYDGIGSTARTLEDCKTGCIKYTPTCLAFDFTTVKGSLYQCYYHTNETYSNNAHVHTGVKDVNQYVRITYPCPAPTTLPPPPPTTRPAGTTRPTPVPTTQPCVDTFSENKDKHSGNGKKLGVYPIAEGCLKACVDIDECEVVDYDTISKMCYYFTQKDGRFIDTALGVNQYTRIRCQDDKKTTNFMTGTTPCQSYFTVQHNIHGPGERAVPNQNSVSKCQNACVLAGDESCSAFDFNTVLLTCWFIPKKYLDKLREAKGIDHYVKQSGCAPKTTMAPVCKKEYKKFSDKHWFSGKLHKLERTKDACEDKCNRIDCMAFDYNREMEECYIYPASSDYNTRYLVDDLHIDSYMVFRGCNEPISVCSVKFETVAATHSKMGVPVSGADTEKKCKDFCVSEQSCLAVDFNMNSSPKCYYHTTGYLFLSAPEADSVQYRIRRCD